MVPLLHRLHLVSIHNVGLSKMEGSGSDPLRCFFTIHTLHGALLYVSECVVMLFTAQQFGAVVLPHLPRHITKFCVRFYIQANEDYQFYLVSNLDTRRLTRVEKSCSWQPECFGPNAVVCGFDDRMYTTEDDIVDRSIVYHRPVKQRTVQSYTFNQIRQLSGLVSGVQDFARLKAALAVEINSRLRDHQSHHELLQKQLESQIASLDKLIAKQTALNADLALQTSQLESQIALVFHTTETSKTKLEKNGPAAITSVKSRTQPLYEALHASLFPDVLHATQALVLLVAEAFPITLVDKTGLHSILGIEFPGNSEQILTACSRLQASGPSVVDQVNAALSHIVRLTNILAQFLGVSLIYPMRAIGSHSTVHEDLSVLQVACQDGPSPQVTLAEYPLHVDAKSLDAKGGSATQHASLERGLLLLKRNIDSLLSATANFLGDCCDQSLRLQLLRGVPPSENVLWCLQYLMLFVTAQHDSGNAS